MWKYINFTLLCLQAILYIVYVEAIPRENEGDKEELDVAQDDLPFAERQLEENVSGNDDDESPEADTLESEERNIYVEDVESEDEQGNTQSAGQGCNEKRSGSLNHDKSIQDSGTKVESSENNKKVQNKMNLYDKIKSAIRRSKLVIKDRDKRLSGHDNKQTPSSFEPSGNYEDTSLDENDGEDYDESQLTPGKDVNAKKFEEYHHDVKGKSSKKLQFCSKKQETSDSHYITELNKAFNVVVCAVEKFMDLANKTMIAKTNTEFPILSETTRGHPISSPDHKDTTTTSTSSNSKETSSSYKETSSTSMDNSSEDSTTTDSTSSDFASTDTTSTSKETTSTSTDTETIPTTRDAEETRAPSNTPMANDHSGTARNDLTFSDEICTTKRKLEKGESTIRCDPEMETTEFRRRKLSKEEGNARTKQKTQRLLSTDDGSDGDVYVYHEYDSVDPNEHISMVPGKVSTLPNGHLKPRKSRPSTHSSNAGEEEEENPIIQKYSSKKTIHNKKGSSNKTNVLMKSLIPKGISSLRKQHYNNRKQKDWSRKRRGKISYTKNKKLKKFFNQSPNFQHSKVLSNEQMVKTKSHNPYSDTETVELEYV